MKLRRAKLSYHFRSSITKWILTGSYRVAICKNVRRLKNLTDSYTDSLSSIALPFETDSLQSLYSEKSAFALIKYYIASVKCIISRSNTRTQLQRFNKDFYVWLQQSVRIAAFFNDSINYEMSKNLKYQNLNNDGINHEISEIDILQLLC